MAREMATAGTTRLTCAIAARRPALRASIVDSMNITVRMAQSSDLNRILTAYDTWGYGGGMKAEDTAWLAEVANELIGIVRIAPENGTLVLRGMRIAEQWRRRGIGSRMLRVLAAWLGNRESYCVPYTHLVDFYGQIGFVEVAPAATPAFLAQRVAEYRRRSLNVTMMVRPPSTI
jgi:N-acetylglutamate synthase-like GNAT family acetyltransferase